MEFFSDARIKTFILRHRSVAVLIRRGHLDDARRLLASLSADLDALEGLPSTIRNHPTFSSRASVLDAEIGPGELEPQIIRRLRDQNALCLKAVLSMADAQKSSGSRRTPLLLGLVPVFLAILLGGAYHFIESAKQEKALKDLQFLSQIMTVAKHKTSKTLAELTGNSCSECPCRSGHDMRGMLQGDICQTNWIRAVAACWKAASGESPYDVYGDIILEKRFLRDPWNSPYALDENAGILRSAGRDGILNTDDDISVTIQTLIR